MGARRIVLKGTSGAGKTTIGRELARRLQAPFVELDALTHGPNWAEATDAELWSRVEAALVGHESWVVDGNYDRKLGGLIVDRADLVVWLDLALSLKLVRVWRRTWRRIQGKETLWNGNRETWRGAFIGTESLFVWMIRCHFRHRRAWPRLLAGRNVVRLRTPREVDRWLETFETASS